jgi:hypothetical protein
MGYLCSGKTWAKPVSLFDFLRCVHRDLALGDLTRKEIGSRLYMHSHTQLAGDQPASHHRGAGVRRRPGRGGVHLDPLSISQRTSLARKRAFECREASCSS